MCECLGVEVHITGCGWMSKGNTFFKEVMQAIRFSQCKHINLSSCETTLIIKQHTPHLSQPVSSTVTGFKRLTKVGLFA